MTSSGACAPVYSASCITAPSADGDLSTRLNSACIRFVDFSRNGFFFVSRLRVLDEINVHAGLGLRDASGLLRLPVQRQQQVSVWCGRIGGGAGDLMASD